jgi:subtilase family serine protease
MPRVKHSLSYLLAGFFFFGTRPAALLSQSNSDAATTALSWVVPHDRVVGPVEENERVTLKDSTLPQARPAYETGTLDGAKQLDHMVLVLKPSSEQQAALDTLTAAQQDPQSPLYHQWLTPEQFAEHFGVSGNDIEQVKNWLERHGLRVDEVTASHRSLIFSGSVAQVESAFQTSMRSYHVGGKDHIANSSDPLLPAALAPVVAGVASLHDVFSAPQSKFAKVSPQYTSGSAHYLTPADYATIYDISTLYHQAYTGSGETIAIPGRADISVSDVRSFRSQFGLAAQDPVVIVNGSDPGGSAGGDMYESMLDVEWSGAVATGATIDFVTSASTATSDGIFLSAQYIVNHNVAPIMSVSYGLCETSLGSGGNSAWNALWQQAAAEGISVLVSSGDSGAAGCDSSSATKGTQGRGVNGMCSTPYSTCVGGSEFSEGGNSGQYWNNSNGSGGESAIGYIPEVAWNESGSTGLWSTGGGVSTTYAKPSWQTGLGVPADGKRDVPDVALTGAGHDAYLVQVSGALYAFSGTSAASPSFAGLLALVAQKTGARLGNANPELYSLAAAQHTSGGAAVFHDLTSGSNTVPGVTGFTAAAGYDQTTGLGSVDAAKLVTSWSTGTTTTATPALTLTVSSSSVALSKTGSSTTVTTAVSGGFKSAVTLSVSGAPAGLTATLSPATLASPGSGTSTLKLTPASTLAPGSWTLTITASGGGITKTATITVSTPGLTLNLTPAATSLARASTLKVALVTTAVYGFNSALSFAASGLPTGVTAAFSPATLAAPGTGTVTLTLTASKTATLGTGKVQVTVTGTGFSGIATVPFTVVSSTTNSRGHLL